MALDRLIKRNLVSILIALVVFLMPNFAFAQSWTGYLPKSFTQKKTLPDAITFRIQIELGDIEQAKEWLDAGLDPNFQGDRLGTGLHIAAWNGNIPMMELFLSRGAKVTQTNKNQEQALQLAALQGQIAAVEWLIKRGAPINAATPGSVWTALHYAAFSGKKELVNRLLEKGADIDARAPNGTTPLMSAIYEGKREVAELLVKRGADRSLKNDWGDGALEWAMKYNQADLAKLIASPEQFAAAANRPKADWVAKKSEATPSDLLQLFMAREQLVMSNQSTQKIDQAIAALRAKYARQAMADMRERTKSISLNPLVISPNEDQRQRLLH